MRSLFSLGKQNKKKIPPRRSSGGGNGDESSSHAEAGADMTGIFIFGDNVNI